MNLYWILCRCGYKFYWKGSRGYGRLNCYGIYGERCYGEIKGNWLRSYWSIVESCRSYKSICGTVEDCICLDKIEWKFERFKWGGIWILKGGYW